MPNVYIVMTGFVLVFTLCTSIALYVTEKTTTIKYEPFVSTYKPSGSWNTQQHKRFEAINNGTFEPEVTKWK